MLQARYMAVDFHADMQKELNYFAGPKGMGVDGVYLDCPSSGVEWLASLQYAAKRAAAQSKVITLRKRRPSPLTPILYHLKRALTYILPCNS